MIYLEMSLKQYTYFIFISLLTFNASYAQLGSLNSMIGKMPIPDLPKPPSIGPRSQYEQSRENTNALIIHNIEKFNQQQRELQALENEEPFDKEYEQYLYKIRHYTAALNELINMANGKERYNFTKAAFLPENAFFDSQIEFDDYQKLIREKVRLARLIMKRENLDTSNNLSKNYAIQKLFTTSISEKKRDGTFKVTKPMTYDFDDYRGDKNPAKVFTYKLLKTGKGQCYSMPVVVKSIANELRTSAYLSYAPEHVYVKFIDNNGQLYNFETTRGSNTTEQFITESGYVSATAMKNKMYMDTLSRNKEISMFLFTLANNFMKKFGYLDFVLECTNEALKLDSTNIHAMMLRSDYYTLTLDRGIRFYGIQPRDISLYTDLAKLKRLRDEQYEKIDNSGYQLMPEGAYNRWLNALNSEKVKEQNKALQKSIQNQLQHIKQ